MGWGVCVRRAGARFCLVWSHSICFGDVRSLSAGFVRVNEVLGWGCGGGGGGGGGGGAGKNFKCAV